MTTTQGDFGPGRRPVPQGGAGNATGGGKLTGNRANPSAATPPVSALPVPVPDTPKDLLEIKAMEAQPPGRLVRNVAAAVPPASGPLPPAAAPIRAPVTAAEIENNPEMSRCALCGARYGYRVLDRQSGRMVCGGGCGGRGGSRDFSRPRQIDPRGPVPGFGTSDFVPSREA